VFAPFSLSQVNWMVPSSLITVININSMLLQGAHPSYRPAQSNIVPASDPLCDRVQRNPNECNYDINYADRSSSMGAYVRDNMQLISEDGERENIEIVFGYEPTFQLPWHI